MKKLFPVICLFSCLIAAHSFAGSATWSANPTSNDWSAAANWTPNTVPNGPSDVATFAGSSSITNLKFSSVTTEVAEIVFDPDATSFNITADASLTSPRTTLTISGPGITNNSGVTQSLTAGPSVQATTGTIEFLNGATAGNGTVLTALGQARDGAFGGSVINFYDRSTADTAIIVAEAATGRDDAGGGHVTFFENTTAANANFTVTGAQRIGGSGGKISFTDGSTAANASFTIGGAANGGNSGEVVFSGNSTAGTAQFTVAGGEVTFFDKSTAADATFVCEAGGGVNFSFNNPTAADALFILNGGSSSGAAGGGVGFSGGTAGNATIIANSGTNGGSGGQISYFANDDSEARVELFGNAALTVYLSSGREARVTVGSIEGDGSISLSTDRHLVIGSNDLSTTFSGTITDFGSGSVEKIGNGTLTLSGANTYAGGTTISAGTLLSKNTAGSATGTGLVQVSGGILGGRGIITGATTVGSGSGSGGVLQPGRGASTATTLTIQSSVTFRSDGTYTWKLNTKKAKADQVISNGVTIQSGAQFGINTVGNKKLTAGKVFTSISNNAATAISGTFSNLADGSVVTLGVNKLQVSYSGGDGNDLTLTVVQ
jgi:autotransporter-associated beta strand protein